MEGRLTSEHQPRDLADVVGVVGQDPLAGFRDRRGGGRARLRDGAASGAG
ncbi:MAG: hypothetical protein M5U19_11440 [Microthrixaceae bacterium]|nr:hypothetical protein [Microthrixaceae bacterium]